MHCNFEQLKLSTPVTPSAPPPYNPMACQGACSCCTTCGSGRVSSWRDHDLASAFPVLEDQNNQRYHQPLDFKLVKQLKEAVMQYGPQAAFTVSLLETIAGMNLVPGDWGNLACAILSGGQYLVWKTAWQEYSEDTARRNAVAGNPQ